MTRIRIYVLLDVPMSVEIDGQDVEYKVDTCVDSDDEIVYAREVSVTNEIVYARVVVCADGTVFSEVIHEDGNYEILYHDEVKSIYMEESVLKAAEELDKKITELRQ